MRPEPLRIDPAARATAVRTAAGCAALALLLAAANACGKKGPPMPPLITLPVRAAFNYRKKAGRREYVRVALKRTADGGVEALKHKQEGAGVLTSLTETDGLVELADCKGLRRVYLYDTKVTAPGIAGLKKALPDCDVTQMQIE